MKLSIRTWLLFVLPIFLNTGLLAGNFSARPVSPLPHGFFATLRNWDTHLNLRKRPNSAKSVVKICSCQILNLQSNNYRQSDMGVFAERSSEGHFSTDLLIAKKTIEKEKKHIKLLFYDKLKVVDRISEATDCKSLYLKLKMNNNSLVIYDILDADQGH